MGKKLNEKWKHDFVVKMFEAEVAFEGTTFIRMGLQTTKDEIIKKVRDYYFTASVVWNELEQIEKEINILRRVPECADKYPKRRMALGL